MKKFLAVYLGSEDGDAYAKWEALDEVTRNKREKEGMNAWMAWADKNAKVIAEEGSPVGTTKRINSKGISDVTNQIVAYTVVEAESHEAAAKMFVNHPHFTIFPGDSVEVMECLPLPTM